MFKIIKNLLTLCLSVAITFIFLEVGARLIIHGSLTIPEYSWYTTACEYDSVLGWKHKAGSTYITNNLEYSTRLEFNSKGLRGLEYDYKKEEGVNRILILGDSYAEGYTVEFDELFSEVLKKELNKDKRIKTEVINAGVGGYSTDQELLFFLNEGKKYKPDIVILMFYQNDVWFNQMPEYFLGPKPMYVLDEEGLVLKNVPLAPVKAMGKKRTSIHGHFKQVRENIKKHSALLSFVGKRITSTYFLRELINNINRRVSLQISRSTGIPEFNVPKVFMVLNKEYDDKLKKAWFMTELLIVELNKQVIKNNGELMVFFVPAPENIYDKVWIEAKNKYGFNSNEWDVERPRKEIKNICQKNMIKFIDPTEKMKKMSKDKDKRLYFNVDRHWTKEGNNFVGRFLADYLTRE